MRESILPKIFIRPDKSVSIFKWIKMTLLEAYLGEQLLDLLGSFSSYTRGTRVDGFLAAGANGYKSELDNFIPATLINKLLFSGIKDILEYKYINHYQVMREADRVVEKNGIPTNNPIQYEVNPEKLYLLTELRLSYNTIWVGLNLFVDVVVFIYTENLLAAITTGAIIEFIRRFKI